MKLTHSQVQYALNKVDKLVQDAKRRLKGEDDGSDAIIAALEAKGFIISDDYYAHRGIKLPETAASKKKREAADAKLKEVELKASNARDQIMLGDQAEVITLLQKLQKELG